MTMSEESGIMENQGQASPELLGMSTQGPISNHRTNGGMAIRVRRLSFSTTSIIKVSA